MVKKIGNFLIILFLCFHTFIITQDIYKANLKVTDLNNNELQTAGIGVPFKLNLSIESSADNISTPFIENLNKVNYTNKGTLYSFTNRNGRISIKKEYNYELRIDKEGSYTFGPVYINNKKFDSYLTINVEEQQKSNHLDKNNEILFKISIDKNPVFINQENEITLKFYSKKNHNVDFQNFKIPTLSDFSITEEPLNRKGTEKIDGENYLFEELKYKIYANKTGDLIIPAITANFEIPVIANNFFNFFMGPQFERKHSISNALKVTVLPIPPFKNEVNGVGNFKNFHAQVNQNVAYEGEGIVLKLEIECEKCNIENLKINKLNLDKSVNYYDSKTYINPTEDNFQKKTFEFILQSKEVKNYQIPEQKFTFFDAESKFFQTLTTKPIAITIKPLNEKEDKDSTINKDIQDDIKPIYTNYNPTKKYSHIKQSWFILLFLLPISINILFLLNSYLMQFNKYKNFKLHRSINKKLNKAQKQNDSSQLYKIFTMYFASKFEINSSNITEEFINVKLEENKFDSNILKQWKSFFSVISQIAFSNEIVENQNLFKNAKQWIEIFKSKL